jgi:hypothetical protein
VSKRRKSTPPDHRNWRKDDKVTVDNISFKVVAILHDDRCSTYCLVAADGTKYRYAPPLSLHRIT